MRMWWLYKHLCCGKPNNIMYRARIFIFYFRICDKGISLSYNTESEWRWISIRLLFLVVLYCGFTWSVYSGKLGALEEVDVYYVVEWMDVGFWLFWFVSLPILCMPLFFCVRSLLWVLITCLKHLENAFVMAQLFPGFWCHWQLTSLFSMVDVSSELERDRWIYINQYDWHMKYISYLVMLRLFSFWIQIHWISTCCLFSRKAKALRAP